MFIQFGAGQCFGNPIGGNLAGAVAGTTASTQPVRFMTIQDIDVTVDQTLKELKGQYKFPDDVAPADMKITGKIGSGRISVDAYNQLFFADLYTAGENSITVAAEAHTVPAATPYTVQIAPPGSGTFELDLGVQYANGQPLAKVATVSAVGQYSVSSAGLYTFDAADASAAILISYNYKLTASGHTLAVNNQLMGYGPSWEMWLAQPYQGTNGLHLFQCRASKLNFPLKRDDYELTEIDFEAYPNASGQVMEFFTQL